MSNESNVIDLAKLSDSALMELGSAVQSSSRLALDVLHETRRRRIEQERLNAATLARLTPMGTA